MARSRATHCPRGHVFDCSNTYIRPDNGRQVCRTCSRERQRERRASSMCRHCYGSGKVLGRDEQGRLLRDYVPCPHCVGSADRRTPPT